MQSVNLGWLFYQHIYNHYQCGHELYYVEHTIMLWTLLSYGHYYVEHTILYIIVCAWTRNIWGEGRVYLYDIYVHLINPLDTDGCCDTVCIVVLDTLASNSEAFASKLLKIWNTCFLDATNVAMSLVDSNLQPHTTVLPVGKGLNMFTIIC